MREWIVQTLGGGAAALAVLVAVLGLAGALGGAATSYIIGQQTVYVNSITTQRMKWVDSLRGKLVLLLAKINIVSTLLAGNDDIDMDRFLSLTHEIDELRQTLFLQLNPRGLIDGNVASIVDALVKSPSTTRRAQTGALATTLREHSQWLLKAEWERIKFEARSPFGKLLHRGDFKKLQQEYEDYIRGPHNGLALVRQTIGS